MPNHYNLDPIELSFLELSLNFQFTKDIFKEYICSIVIY